MDALIESARATKYILVGFAGISVNLMVYYFSISYAHLPYIIGSVIAFLIAAVIGFLLQKYWTFEDRDHKKLPLQFMGYGLVTLSGLGISTLIVYGLITYLGIYYLFAQAGAALVVALFSFFVYRNVLFRPVSI